MHLFSRAPWLNVRKELNLLLCCVFVAEEAPWIKIFYTQKIVPAVYMAKKFMNLHTLLKHAQVFLTKLYLYL